MIPSILPTYNRAPLSFVKGEGSWLIEADGLRPGLCGMYRTCTKFPVRKSWPTG